MVSSEPDVSLLTSSAQIFASNHTLPQIRQIHKALHVQVDDKAARLRTQVGGSYRELLGTADTIVQMRSDMEGAQATLAGMGGRCGRAVVGGKVAALSSFVEHEQEQSSLSLAARARLLDACARTVCRLLSRNNTDYIASYPSKSPNGQQHRRHHPEQKGSWGERLVLAAKVLVLSRLLISSIHDKTPQSGSNGIKDSSETQPISRRMGPQDKSGARNNAVLASIEASKRTLNSLRRRLRDIVEIVERSLPATTLAKSAADESEDDDDDDSDSASDGEKGFQDRHGTLSATVAGREDLLRALCAHSLATTSGARDVLWQLLHVRSQAMARAFDLDDEDLENSQQQQQNQNQTLDRRATWRANNILRGLALYTKTLLDVQALLPHRLPEALLGLKKQALLDDNILGQIEGLRLDLYARWCGEDVQYFKPYVRHDDLDGAQAREMLSKWADRGSEVLLSGLRRALEQQPSADAQQQPPRARHHIDLHTIVDLRTRVLQLWIRDSSKARGIDPSDLLDKLREIFNHQMLQVVNTKVAKLRLVGSEVAATLNSWQDGVNDRHASLWSNSAASQDVDGKPSSGGRTLDTDLSSGAVPFVREVVTRLHGRSDAVAKAVTSYMTWLHVVDDVTAIVDLLRRQRWDNDVDDIIEDEETVAQRQQLLSRQDPQTLHDELENALETAFQELNEQIVAEWTKVANSDSSDTTKGSIAMYVARVLREIRSRRPATTVASAQTDKTLAASNKAAPKTSRDTSSSAAVSQLGLEIIPALHTAIARVVVAAPLDQLTSKVLTRKTVAGRLLWDGQGQAALPSTPSPGIFKFLRDLSTSMGDAGMDLWSPAAVAQLKQQVSDQLGEQWFALLETAEYLQVDKTKGEAAEEKVKSEKEEEVGEEEDAGENGYNAAKTPASATITDDQRHDLLVQWLFDIAWLQCSLSIPTLASSPDVPSKKGEKEPRQFFAELADVVYQRTGLSEDAGSDSGKTPRQRVTKAAQEYWKKTSLLFGLLA